MRRESFCDVLPRRLWLIAGLACLIAAGVRWVQAAAEPTPEALFPLNLDRPYVQPLDVDRAALARVSSDADLPKAQRLFDVLSWREFIVLNWPAGPDGEPDPNGSLADSTTPKVWESWKQTSDVFLKDGGRPKPWGEGSGPRSMSLDHWKAGWRQHTTLDQGLQAFSGPLVDQNGNWVHYQALMNRREFDYLVSNELYNLEGQAAYARDHTIEFPVNDDRQPGAVEVKLAWKVLTPADDESRYLVRRLPIVRYGTGASFEQQRTGKALGGRTSERVKVGLIGMHIAMRTVSSPQWIWATFEHIDNTRIDESTVPAGRTVLPSLSRPDDPVALVRANLLPPKNGPKDPRTGEPTDWAELPPGAPGALEPVEVLRLVPPPPAAARLNREAQALLSKAGSVLRYYELIGTQWPRHPSAPAVPGGQGSAPESIIRKMPGDVVPVYLINSTMETYFQKGYQDAGPLEQDDRVPFTIDTTKVFGTESCVGCHYSAGACIGFRKDSFGKEIRDSTGRKTPTFGQNSNGGSTGSANFSWALQIEAQSKDVKPPRSDR